ncbi:hypothetical protein [Anaerocolumna xylanovorans]|uniref:Type IV pilus assembly protein PilO n=1 Tax=Anaerocolumna xylanovorans DSM 12503 TaxID=1121345 RepID=A0A1M7YN26_9FIRM|nr:hypothetical protein [Anaerocolumna xylanovorans]SHO53938.1 hypothetical protein SAMN02745217_04379 [Anaerocolumna xylanovorans DSM 12503]
MKLELKLTQRDKKLLLIVVSLVLFAVSYFLIYQRNVSAAQEIRTSNEALKSKVQELTQMQAQAEDKKAETEKLRSEMEDMKARFPVYLSTADIILLLDGMEFEAGMEISSSTFTEHQIFYPNTASGEGTASDSQTTDNAADTSGTDTGNAVQANKFTGMKSTVSISFKTTYEGLKKAIDYINKNSDRMTIGELSTTYDTATGNLTGSMTINMYMLAGSGVQKTYEPPNMDDIKTGRDNIFGTLK